MSDLRDHSQPCEHWTSGQVYASATSGWWTCPQGRCPGGREVTINYEAGAALHLDAPGWGASTDFPDWLMENVRQIVDAAIGDIDG